MGYSWDIHGVFICVGYVSGMYRVCIGNGTEQKRGERGERAPQNATSIFGDPAEAMRLFGGYLRVIQQFN